MVIFGMTFDPSTAIFLKCLEKKYLEEFQFRPSLLNHIQITISELLKSKIKLFPLSHIFIIHLQAKSAGYWMSCQADVFWTIIRTLQNGEKKFHFYAKNIYVQFKPSFNDRFIMCFYEFVQSFRTKTFKWNLNCKFLFRKLFVFKFYISVYRHRHPYIKIFSTNMCHCISFLKLCNFPDSSDAMTYPFWRL